MGGGDANNKTLELLKGLTHCNVPATFWVMLGEGYKHSLDELTDQIRKDAKHEIILAKTNSSMWHILANCVLAILPGGITSFEAVRAGLPSINFFDTPEQEYLIKEICENNAAFNFGKYSTQTINEISLFIEQLYYNRKTLLKMHVDSKGLIDGNGAIRIIEDIINDRNN
jgi:spore coat polysaccharide biosynthesis predicted glycosyltransferase SpsG